LRTTGKKLTVTAARFLLFIKKLFPVVGLLTFFKNFSFRRFNSARPLRQGFAFPLVEPFQSFQKQPYLTPGLFLLFSLRGEK